MYQPQLSATFLATGQALDCSDQQDLQPNPTYFLRYSALILKPEGPILSRWNLAYPVNLSGC